MPRTPFEFENINLDAYNPNPEKTLRSSYLKSLQIADELGVKTIAFPSISTGAFAYPLEEAAPIALSVFKSFKGKNITTIIMCAFNKKTYDAYQKENIQKIENH